MIASDVVSVYDAVTDILVRASPRGFVYANGLDGVLSVVEYDGHSYFRRDHDAVDAAYPTLNGVGSRSKRLGESSEVFGNIYEKLAKIGASV